MPSEDVIYSEHWPPSENDRAFPVKLLKLGADRPKPKQLCFCSTSEMSKLLSKRLSRLKSFQSSESPAADAAPDPATDRAVYRRAGAESPPSPQCRLRLRLVSVAARGYSIPSLPQPPAAYSITAPALGRSPRNAPGSAGGFQVRAQKKTSPALSVENSTWQHRSARLQPSQVSSYTIGSDG